MAASLGSRRRDGTTSPGACRRGKPRSRRDEWPRRGTETRSWASSLTPPSGRHNVCAAPEYPENGVWKSDGRAPAVASPAAHHCSSEDCPSGGKRASASRGSELLPILLGWHRCSASRGLLRYESDRD